MVLVMVVHADFKALGIPSNFEIAVFPVSSFMRFLTESVSIICVNSFILISGWFGIKFKLLRLGELLFQILFFVVIMCCVLGMVNKLYIEDLIRFFCDDYWFIMAYIIMYLFAPSLNYFVVNESKRTIEVFLVLFFLFQTVFGFMTSLSWFSRGYSPISFMGLYVLGRYMHLYPTFTKQKRSVYILTYLTMVILTTCFAYFLFLIEASPYYAYSYSSPLVIIGSVSFFLFFTKLSCKSRIINWIGISCFSIYLVHCFPVFFENVYLYSIKEWFDNLSTLFFLVCTFLWILLFLVVSVFFDKIRIYLWYKTSNHFGWYNWKELG